MNNIERVAMTVSGKENESDTPLYDLLLEAIGESLPDDPSDDDIGRAAEAAFERLFEDGSKELYLALKKHIPSGIGAEAKARRGFERRNQRRWAAAFDLLEMMLICSGEQAGAVSRIYGQAAADAGDLSFPAIKHLHAKSILIGREILHLCRGGYPDGALARWRSLHEAAVIATFLKEQRELAPRFIASFDHRAVKAAEQLNRFADRANLQPFDEVEIEHMRAQRDAHRISDNLALDFEWARPALSISDRRPVNFADIERHVGLDHWRPRYRWASQHNHAPYRPLNNTLGEAESEAPVFLIGPSNSGMVDPLCMTALSLTVSDGAFFMLYPDTDRTVGLKVQMLAADEIGPLAMKLQRDTLESARGPRNRPAANEA